MEYNTKVFSPKKIKNNSRDIFTSLHNYVIEYKVHYPIYKLNAIYDIFYNPNFATVIYNKSELKTSRYKTFNRTLYMIFDRLGKLGTIDESEIMQTALNITLYPFQTEYKGLHRSAPLDYDIVRCIDLDKYIDDDRAWKYHISPKFCIRIKPLKIYILSHATKLPFQDIMVQIFLKEYQKYFNITLGKNDNYFGIFKLECIDKRDYPNHQIFENLIDITKTNVLDEADINSVLHTTYIYRQRLSFAKTDNPHSRYLVTDKIVNLFNQKSYTDAFLESIFNPKKFIEPANGTLSPNVLIRTNSESHSDNSESHSESHIDNDNNNTNNNIDTNNTNGCDIQKFNYCYNKYYDFDNEKSIIEQSISHLILKNINAYNLFDLYTDIKVLKPIGKCYTDKRYFNIILYNSVTKLVSPSYHCYLDNDNTITAITRILNLI